MQIIYMCKATRCPLSPPPYSFSSDQQDETSAAPALHGFLPNLQLWPEASTLASYVSNRYVYQIISFFHYFGTNKFSTGQYSSKSLFLLCKAKNAEFEETFPV